MNFFRHDVFSNLELFPHWKGCVFIERAAQLCSETQAQRCCQGDSGWTAVGNITEHPVGRQKY